MLHDRPPLPWHSFLVEADRVLDRPVALHCLGGFVSAMLYGLPRPTVDVDCLAVIPVEATSLLQSVAGPGSPLHIVHGAYVQHVGIVTVPENYADRLASMFPKAYGNLSLWGLSPTHLRRHAPAGAMSPGASAFGGKDKAPAPPRASWQNIIISGVMKSGKETVVRYAPAIAGK